MSDLDPALLTAAGGMLARGQGLEAALTFLRARGCHVIDCIRIVRAITDCGLAEAKDIVHTSAAWADRRAAHDRFHDEILAALRTLAEEDPRVSLRESDSEIIVDLTPGYDDAPTN